MSKLFGLSSVAKIFDYNASTLSGCIDVIAVQHDDGIIRSTPFHCRFGKLKLFRSYKKKVKVFVNDELIDSNVYLGHDGEAYFIHEKVEVEREASDNEVDCGRSVGSDSDRPFSEGNDYLDEDFEIIPNNNTYKEANYWAWGRLPTRKSGNMTNTIENGGVIQVPLQSQINIGSRKNYSLKIPVSTPGDIVTYTFSTLYYDISFGINFEDYDGIITPLLPVSRVKSHAESINGCIITTGVGYINLVWDNSYSLMTSKTIDFSLDYIYANSIIPVPIPVKTQYGNGLLELSRSDNICIISLPFGRGYMPSSDIEILSSKKDIDDTIDKVDAPGVVDSLTDDFETHSKKDDDGSYDDYDDNELTYKEESLEDTISIALCKSLLTKDMNDEQKKSLFKQKMISYDEYASNPSLISNKELVFMINGQFMDPIQAYPYLIKIAVYNKSPKNTLKKFGGYDNLATQQRSQSRHKIVKQKSEKNKKITYTKSIKPNQQDLANMKLKKGKNKIRFEVTSSFHGTSSLEGSIYLYDPRAKLIITDIDGTITMSDLLGHIMYMVGMDWYQRNVCELFSAIHNNGYEILYLSTRNIGLMDMTKNLLINLSQDGTNMPDGPLIISPDRLFAALKREVILNTPHEYKVTALMDIKNVFPEGSYPFFAGFGNKPTDAYSYRTVAVPDAKIFLIDTKGNIKQPNSTFLSSYKDLINTVDLMFPPSKSEQFSRYNSSLFWKMDYSVCDND